jgi:hypothetical protein
LVLRPADIDGTDLLDRLAVFAGSFGDAITSSILAGLEFVIDPPAAAQWAQRAETLIASGRSPALVADVLSNLSLYYALAGDPRTGIDYCQRALALARTYDARVSVHTAHMRLAQLAAMGALEDPTPILRDAIADAYHEHVWVHLWSMVAGVAQCWARQDRLEEAGVLIGHLDTNHFRSWGSDTLEETRAAVAQDPDAARWLAQGAQLNGEELVVFIVNAIPGRR